MLTPATLERHQVGIYLTAILLGLLTGGMAPLQARSLEGIITPVLAGLLYVTFLQVPLTGLRRALTHGRFLGALFSANFLVVPLLVWLLADFLPENPALRLGIFLVLLTPCIDYVVVFAHLGKGDARLLLAATPVLLLVQILLLPLYLGLFLGRDALALMQAGPFVEAFLWLILLPLGLAWLTEVWSRNHITGRHFAAAMGWLPVPLMALTLFLVVAAESPRVGGAFAEIIQVVPVYIAFAVCMPVLARLVGRFFALDHLAGRALVFSASTRNSLVVLPLAFAVPGGGLVPAVIVTQTLVELLGELVYIRWVPRLVPEPGSRRTVPGIRGYSLKS